MRVTYNVNLGRLFPHLQAERAMPQKSQVEFGPFEPTCFAEFIGQEDAKSQLTIELDSARRDGRPLRHIFLYGPPGTGKTTLVKILAKESPWCNGYLFETTGAQFSTPESVIDGFREYKEYPKGALWLLDEVSEMAKTASTVFHAPMTQYALVWKGTKDTDERIRHMTLCATTNYVAKSPGAFRDRFDLQIKMGYYKPHELTLIAAQSAERLRVDITEEAAEYIGAHAAGTPRQLNRLMRHSQAIVSAGGRIGLTVAQQAAYMLGVYSAGINQIQVNYLKALACSPKNTMGRNALAALLGEDARTLEDVWEPYLLYLGLITITGSGRRLTDAGIKFLEVERL
jgi:Holliday junction DNA helicase RuvB